ncbi:hypothetical protein EW145_g5555 [Phellinidium pouzarii]|uniref:CBS domain-containing protein n=1 Tax=Phellinidium pouzarii TaxID=167371 RepID=A0A4S4KZJ9_9AGAM|nr:hypothetical protein EW145_g5555 [Phellinidium pouzarii]
MELASRSPYIAAVSLSTTGRDSPVVFAPNSESEAWLRDWRLSKAKDLIDAKVVIIGADTAVEDACDALLSDDIACIAIKAPSSSTGEVPYLGLFDFADVNAFLTLAATQHTLSPEDLRANPRVEQIVNAAKAGKVPVRLIYLESLQQGPTEVHLSTYKYTLANVAHPEVLIRPSSSTMGNSEYLGYVSDRALLAYFHKHAQASAPLARFLANPLHSLALPSLSLRAAVVCCSAGAPLHEAMALMSAQGVSSVAVVEDSANSAALSLLSAVSVTDVGKIVLPSQSKQVLQMPLQQFIAQIKHNGSYNQRPRHAANAHRVFITEDLHSHGSSPSATSAPPLVPGPGHTATTGVQLRGVVSIVDVLALFARLANLSDVDPTRMQRHRRASSARSLSPEVVSNR